MVENLHNDIDHPSSKSEILDEHFDEELKQEQRQELEQEKEKWRRDQHKKANELAQQLNQNEIKKQNDIPQQTKDSSQENGKRKWNEKEITKYVGKLIKQNDFKWIFDYLWLDVKLLDTSNKVKTRDILDKSLIKELELQSEPKDLRNVDKFLNNEDNILNETQEKYEDLYKKIMKIKEWNDDWQWLIFLDLLNKLFKQIRILNNNKISGFLYKSLMHKKIIRNIIEIKYVLKVKRKDFSKYLKRLNEYENWEYINFPNWITFELWKWPETIYWTNINIWENEFYIKTHIEKSWKNKKTKYNEYVDSLIKARKLFEKKWIKLKYCKRHTRLANKEFIKKYEEERKKRKEREWVKYEKSNRLKVLEQTENAIISYRHERYGRSPIRFINKNEDRNLFEFVQNNDNFCEAEMWLDIDKLEHK